MQIDCSAFGCAECCKRYWIMLLPGEARRTAAFLRESLPVFLKKHCLLQAQLYPAFGKSPNPLIVPRNGIPKRFFPKIRKEAGVLPSFFLALPTVVFKRGSNNACTFLNLSNGLCGIYPIRPEPCRLFPFIPWKKKPLAESYLFCAFLQNQKKPLRFRDSAKKQYQKTAAYFKAVEKKGFAKVWKTVPSRGILRLDDQLLGTVSKKQFFSLLNPR